MSGESNYMKHFWAKILDEPPLPVRRRASYYLENFNKTSENEWVVWSSGGAQYTVRLAGRKVTCTCPYFQEGKGYCKHIACVAVNELVKLDYVIGKA